ncbi:hypothetical protein RRG08_041237 [Elysia crispata]|uniref:Uncharacterized protein n=1 Tax=Elysia crispata TaxID=231223 RepID=A0AAE0YX03_9GAST|nr:hypothetical protein RRG08_041237 [Elysia crispata]
MIKIQCIDSLASTIFIPSSSDGQKGSDAVLVLNTGTAWSRLSSKSLNVKNGLEIIYDGGVGYAYVVRPRPPANQKIVFKFHRPGSRDPTESVPD